jgi:hypothetical protein
MPSLEELISKHLTVAQVCGMPTRGIYVTVEATKGNPERVPLLNDLPEIARGAHTINVHPDDWAEMVKRIGVPGHEIAADHPEGATLYGIPVYSDEDWK